MPDRGAYAIALVGLMLVVSLAASCTLPATESPENLALSPATTYTHTSSPTTPSEPASVAATHAHVPLPTTPSEPAGAMATHAHVPAPSTLPEPTDAIPATAVPKPSASISSTPPQKDEKASISIVFDNNPLEHRLQTGWGFAAWVEYGDSVVLFDTGARGTVLLGNMAALGLHPQVIDSVVLSHNHGDHTGGLAAILSANPRIDVYVPQAFPARIKNQVRSAGANVVEVDEPLEILPGLWTTGQMGTGPVEQALVARTAQGLVVLTGCAHPGVDRMVAQAKEIGRGEIHLVVGGFHLGDASRKHIQRIVDEFRQVGVQQVAPSHCTGDGAQDLFRSEYGKNYHAIGVGWQWQSQSSGSAK